MAYRGQTVLFDALVDPRATAAERLALEVAASEVIADYPSGWLLEVSIRDEEKDDVALPWCVYQRAPD